MKVVVIGSTGLVGKSLVSKLLQMEQVEEIILIVRNKGVFVHEKIHEILLKDMSLLSLESLEINADFYFCALGTTIKKAGSRENFSFVDHDLVLAFSKLAKKADARLYIVSTIGADPASSFFYNRVKGEMERDVKLLNLSSLVVLRPSLLIGDREESRPLEKIGIVIHKITKRILPDRLKINMGTGVEQMIQWIVRDFQGEISGIRIITDFTI